MVLPIEDEQQGPTKICVMVLPLEVVNIVSLLSSHYTYQVYYLVILGH